MRFIGGDFSNIEGRINAWLAGEEWKLEAFQAFDLGYGPDLYRVTASEIIGKPVEEVTRIERQNVGKTPELACGYQGSVGAFITMGLVQTPPLHPEDMIAPIRAVTPAEVWETMLDRHHTARDRRNLKAEEWAAIKLVVTGWRARNPQIVKGWWELQDAAISAVSNPDHPVPVYGGRCSYLCSGGWLYCRLPSGRVIHYANPWIKSVKKILVQYEDRWIDIEDVPVPEGQFLPFGEADISLLKEIGYEVYERYNSVVHFKGIDAETKQWVTKALYGGLQCENIVQGTAACVLRSAMRRVEAAGYPVVLHAHDELLSEVPTSHGSVAEYEALMGELEPWSHGLPLAVKGWEDQRYVK
jgi:DNA polymerase